MTASVLTDEMLATLGLTRDALGSTIVIPTPEAEVAAGLGVAQSIVVGVAALQTLLTSAVFDRIQDPALASAAVRVSAARAHPYVVTVTLAGDAPVNATSINGPDELSVGTDSRDPATRIVDVDRAGPTSILRSDGSGVLIERGSSGSVVTVVRARPLAIPPVAQIVAPITAWCAACPDVWLVQAVLARAAGGHSWDIAVAAGMLGRLVDTSQPSTARRILEAMAAGAVDPTLETIRAPRQWMHRLATRELDTIADLAIAKADRLLDLLESISEDAQPPATRIGELFFGRDDLEGVRTLLAEVDRADDIDALLRFLDERATEWVRHLAAARVPQDERLRRVAGGNAWVWWSGLPANAFA